MQQSIVEYFTWGGNNQSEIVKLIEKYGLLLLAYDISIVGIFIRMAVV